MSPKPEKQKNLSSVVGISGEGNLGPEDLKGSVQKGRSVLDSPESNSILVQIGESMELVPIGLSNDQNNCELQSGNRIVCSTIRGLEMATVIRGCLQSGYNLMDGKEWGQERIQPNSKVGNSSGERLSEKGTPERFGNFLRLATAEDELAIQRLSKFKDEAIEDCNRWIGQCGFPDLVVDTDITLDGTSVFFQFLGPISQELNDRFDELVDLYEKRSKVKDFVQAVELGCGPDCGSDGSGCSTGGGCSSCGLKSACHSK